MNTISEILKTNTANCKDCYKCVRYCPVNAIRISGGHAQVDPDRCILDGKCYKVCPQKAKSVRTDVNTAKEVIKRNEYVVASIAPSFFAYYQQPKRDKILTALQYLGFNHVEQTSRAADTVSFGHLEYSKNHALTICSSCPSSVYLIEKYYPDLIQYLAPVLSPMTAHYRILENELRHPFKMIFIGPCIAKKKEIEGTNIAACLTFEELEDWIMEEDIEFDNLASKNFCNFHSRISSLFPLPGGLIKTVGLSDSNLEKEIISVSGIRNIKELLDSIRENKIKSGFIELLACENGCLMGPVRPKNLQDATYYELKSNLISEFSSFEEEKISAKLTGKELSRTYLDKSIKTVIPTEEEIKQVLASIGKTGMSDEHNCGACGYNSCREKAIAVVQGMAEKEMCIPYMKSRAEMIYSVILEASPNSVVVVDSHLNIVEANPAFFKYVEQTREDLIGKHISAVTDIEPFKTVLENQELIYESKTLINNKEVKRIVFSVPDQKFIAGIFVDISDIEAQKEVFAKVKTETLERAQKVINKQMRVAQEIAGLLGETTAETKVLLGQLVKILQQE